MEENNKTVSGSENEVNGSPNGEPTVEQKKTLKSKIHKFLTDHANIFQIVKFTLISLIAFVAEFASMYALQYGLLDQYGNVPFKWFVFKYTPEKNFGLAGFIAMLGSKCIAEIISFTINRKKTFSANNNVVFSAIMYVITVVAIIILSTWLGGALGSVYGAINIVSDLLSYSRLFGLGLTTGVIGLVMNELGMIIVDVIGPAGWVIAVVIFVGGHVFNLAINLLGAYVHDSRLQYIEFFGRFYEGSGHAFRPLGSEMKYTYLDN